MILLYKKIDDMLYTDRS